MPAIRVSHGCARIKIGSIDYMALLGGGDVNGQFSDIIFNNIERNVWETYLTTIYLPEIMANVKGVIALQLDKEGCQLMIMFGWPVHKLYVCEGNYTWKWIDTT